MKYTQFEFNTGRGYTPEGQVIKVAYEPNPGEPLLDCFPEYRVYYRDISRGISGAFIATGDIDRQPSEYDIQDQLMRGYDNNTNTNVTLGGVNEFELMAELGWDK